MSWKPQIKTKEDDWTSNGVAFETEVEAKAWADDLLSRWYVATEARAIEVDTATNPVNRKMVDGKFIRVEA